MTLRQDLSIDRGAAGRLESDDLVLDVAAEVGGRVVSLRNKALDVEFVWLNSRLPLRVNPEAGRHG